MSENSGSVRAIVIEHYALHTLGSALTEHSWFDHFEIPPDNGRVRRVDLDGLVYLLSNRADEQSQILVIKISNGGLFGGAPNPQEAFDRICHVALSHFESAVAIPTQWKKFTQGQRLSVYAGRRAKVKGDRIYFDRYPEKTNNIYAYALTNKPFDFHEVPEDIELFKNAHNRYLDAVVTDEEKGSSERSSKQFGIVLTESVTANLAQGSGLQDWLDNKLTDEQRSFVRMEYKAPVRLRGAAGTGKTLAMAVKFLNDAYYFEEKGKKKRIAFVTHSWATVRAVQDVLLALDDRNRWGRWQNVELRLICLYDLATELLRYEFEGLEPLSTDGVEG